MKRIYQRYYTARQVHSSGTLAPIEIGNFIDSQIAEKAGREALRKGWEVRVHEVFVKVDIFETLEEFQKGNEALLRSAMMKLTEAEFREITIFVLQKESEKQ